MTFAISAGLQAALFDKLIGDATLTDLVGTAIYDAPPPAEAGEAPTHVTIGEESVRAAGTKTSAGAVHDLTVTVHSNAEGFDQAKRVAGAICDALVGAPLSLARGHLVALRFIWARAERGRPPESRRISLRFRAVVEDNE